MENITVYTNVSSKILRSKLKVYIGYITVKNNGRYLYSKFSDIVRLDHESALQDAKKIVSDLTRHN
jgi:hypothetical protein